jgi:putative restriction endonuclease
MSSPLRNTPRLPVNGSAGVPSSQSLQTRSTGEPFLFKLHYPEHAIVGGGTYVWSSALPASITWEAFGETNGAATLAETRSFRGA